MSHCTQYLRGGISTVARGGGGGGGVVISDRLSLCCNNSNSHFIVFRSASLEDAAGVRICSNYLLFQLSALSVDVFLS